AMGALSMLFGRLQRHVPLRRLLVLGYLVIGLAMLALAACGTGTAYPWVGLLLVALGLGMGLAVPGTGLAVMASVARERSGMASATMNTLRQAGMAVGIALLGALLSGRAIVVLGDRLEELGIADAQRLATQAVTSHRLPGSLAGLDAELPAALAEGFRLAMLVAGASALLAAALLWCLRVSAGPTADTVGASGRTAGVQLQADRR
ncbi:MFS transporter, partial [Pseudomonas aeruginosa]